MGGYALTSYHFCHEIRLFRASFDRKFAKNIGGQRDYFNIIIKLKILKFRLFLEQLEWPFLRGLAMDWRSFRSVTFKTSRNSQKRQSTMCTRILRGFTWLQHSRCLSIWLWRGEGPPSTRKSSFHPSSLELSGQLQCFVGWLMFYLFFLRCIQS